MSGFLGQTGSILGAVSTTASALGNLSSEVAHLAGGSAKSTTNSSMHIDTVHLFPFEGVPDHVAWGTRQTIKEHTYPGGQNVLQAMGPSREPIAWSGRMIGPDATDRARALDAIAKAGLLVSCAWGDLNFDVMVERFSADYKHQWDGSYSITCKALWDYDAKPAQPGAATAAANDLTSSGSVLASVNSAIQPGLQGATQALQTATAVVSRVQTAVTTAEGVVATAQNAVAAVETGNVGSLAGAATSIASGLTVIGGQAVAVSGILTSMQGITPDNILVATGAAGALAGLSQAYATGSRALNNFIQVPGVSTPTVAATAGKDFYEFQGA